MGVFKKVKELMEPLLLILNEKDKKVIKTVPEEDLSAKLRPGLVEFIKEYFFNNGKNKELLASSGTKNLDKAVMKVLKAVKKEIK